MTITEEQEEKKGQWSWYGAEQGGLPTGPIKEILEAVISLSP